MVNRALIAGIICFVSLAVTTAGQAPQPTAAPTAKPEEGIPITDPTVQKACGSCHKSDDKGQMSRISFQRNTPEGWQTIIQRMAALNGLNIEPATARQVVKYLSTNLGLAPEEAKPVAWEAERRLIDFKYTANAMPNRPATRCHSLGRVISQRRTKTEWDLLIATHRGLYPLVDNQAFAAADRRRAIRPRATDVPPDNRHPVEKTIDHLAKTFR
jgi:quinohemoprotein amine dehydrogenase